MTKSMRRLLIVLLSAAMVLMCAVPMGTAGSSELVELRFLTSQIGDTPEAPWLNKMVADFNEANAGSIRVTVDGAAGEAMDTKLRTDAASNSMPDLFMLAAEAARFNLLAGSGRILNLLPYMDEDAELMARIDKVSAAAYTDADGNLLGLPYAKSFVGIYYNKAIFDEAGVEAFPTTWDDFFVACEKILDAGYAPIALMTAENAWTTMLMISNILGTSEAGRSLLKSTPDTINLRDPAFIDAAEKVQTMLAKYTTPDAIGANYAVAANNFLNGKAAMIANGPWMIGEFSNPDKALPGLEQDVAYALAPGSGVIAMENISYASGSKTPEKAAAAFKFLQYMATDAVYAEFLNVSGNAPCIAMDTSLLEMDPINAPFVEQAINADAQYMHLGNAITAAVSDGLSQLLPDLASGALTPEEFASKLQDISDRN